jgi:hypothetical protein
VIEQRTLALDDPTTLGFTASELLARLEGDYAGTFAWARPGGTTVDMTLGLRGTGVATLLRREPVEIGGESCEDEVELELELHLATADGAFDEAAERAIASATRLDDISVHAAISAGAIAGSYEPGLDASVADLARSETPYLFTRAAVTPSGIDGAVSLSLVARPGEGPFPSGMTVMPVAVGSFDAARNVDTLHRMCPADGCAPGQTCVAAHDGSGGYCEIECGSDTDCPSSHRCNLPPVIPDTVPNVCIEA